jgi:hypothetical protein
MEHNVKRDDQGPRGLQLMRDEGGGPMPMDTEAAVRISGYVTRNGEPYWEKDDVPVVGASPSGAPLFEYPAIDTSVVSDVYEGEYVIHWEDGGVETVPNEGHHRVNVLGG